MATSSFSGNGCFSASNGENGDACEGGGKDESVRALAASLAVSGLGTGPAGPAPAGSEPAGPGFAVPGPAGPGKDAVCSGKSKGYSAYDAAAHHKGAPAGKEGPGNSVFEESPEERESEGVPKPREPWERFDAGETSWADCTPREQESIVRHFAPKVKYLALRMKARLPKNVELSELISAGTLGLMESFGKYRPQMGNKFDTYAENRIRGAMLDELRRLDWFPRSLRRRVRVLDEALHKLEHQQGGAPSEEQLARETGLDIKEVREGLEALHNQYCLSLDLIQDSLSPSEWAGEEEPFTRTASQELIDRVAELIDQLTPREKLVLSLYYTDELNMREAAEVMGITEGRVSQLHSQALARLRREFKARHGEAHTL